MTPYQLLSVLDVPASMLESSVMVGACATGCTVRQSDFELYATLKAPYIKQG
ncbi:hypothetical protein [Spirosoma knui]